MDENPRSEAPAPVEPAAPRRRHRFRLGLRALMVVVLVVGGGLGWFAYRARVRRQVVAAVEGAGSRAYDDREYKDGQFTNGTSLFFPKVRARPSWLTRQRAWLEKRIGREYFHDITAVILLPHRERGAEVTGDLVASLARLDRLEHLAVYDTALIPGEVEDVLRQMGRLKALRDLDLEGPSVTDSWLSSVANLANLEKLVLRKAHVTEVGLARLESLDKLGVFSANDDPSFDGIKVRIVSRFPALHSLYLNRTGLTDAGLAYLAGKTGLRTLWIDRANLTDAGFVHLRGLTDLDTLFIQGAGLTDDGLASIAELKGLRKLSLGAKITDAGLARLAKLTGLTSLHILSSGFTDAGLVHLEGMTHLEGLMLVGGKVTDAGLVHLRGLTRLKTLSLDGTQVTPEGLAEIRSALPSLTKATNQALRPAPAAKTKAKSISPDPSKSP